MNNEALKYFEGDTLAASTWQNKYALEGEKTPEDTFKRLAKEFSKIETKNSRELSEEEKKDLSFYGKYRSPLTELDIFNLFDKFKYIIPGGSVLSGLGSKQLVSLSNCFVIDSPEDSYASIMEKRTEQVQLMKRRGGVGYDLSQIRPKGASVNNAAKYSTGAASFMDVCSDLTNETAQNGRRGALMLTISVNHPDIIEFIEKKQDLTKVTGANISVKVTNEFMQAVENNQDYILRFPVNSNIEFLSKDVRPFEYSVLYPVQNSNKTCHYYKIIKAKDLWDKLMYCAHSTAEPGIIFEDTMHDYSPDGVYPNFKMVSTNPCGEIGMGGYDSCRLIHQNLTSYIENPFTNKATLMVDTLYKQAYEAMRLADDLVDLELESIDKILSLTDSKINAQEYILWKKIYENTQNGRRCGLGFTGLADAIAMLNLQYGSNNSLLMIETIMKTIFKAQLDSTIDMAIERGTFKAWKKGDTGLGDEFGHFNPSNSWYSFILSYYPEHFERMSKFGRRNISFNTVAPTGTVSILAGVSSGIEPVFMPFYQRKRKCMSTKDKVDYTDIKGENYTLFTVVHPNLKKWLSIYYSFLTKEELEERCLDISYLEESYRHSPYYGATSSSLNWSNRVKIQGIIQKYITHSISSTINLPKETTIDTISNIYMQAWKDGLKGITVYRDSCREGILTNIVKPNSINERLAPKRPKELTAEYHQMKVKGELFIILVGLLDNKPYEIFAFKPLHPVSIEKHTGILIKNKKMHYSYNSIHINISDLQLSNSNIAEKSITLNASQALRHGIPIQYIIKTIKKVDENITSFASAVCRVLSTYIDDISTNEKCPECGEPIIREGGCLKCSNCTFSKCE